MITSKITKKAQTTIPQAVRAAHGSREVYEIAYNIEEGRIVLTRATTEPADDPFHTFAEWNSEADRQAYADLWAVGCHQGPVPYADRPVRQRRPALVVAAGGIQAQQSLVWVLMITSANNRGLPCDVAVSDLATAGLPAAPVVWTAKIAVIDMRDAERLGTLPTADRSTIAAHLSEHLGGIASLVGPWQWCP